MKILAIETVGTTGSVAAFEADHLLATAMLDTRRRSAQSLAPGIQQLLEQVAWRPADVQLVAVASGPGSFTGLRIGVTTAKAFAYAIGCEVVGVNSLLAIASRAPSEIEQLAVVLDAGRGEFFAADFTRVKGELKEREPTRVVPWTQWVASLRAGQVVSGAGLAKLEVQLPEGVISLAPALWAVDAESIGRTGWRLYGAGQRDTAFSLQPQYFRRTAAEDQWERR